MADIKTVLCCARGAGDSEKCVSCQTSCSCKDRGCHCTSPHDFNTVETRNCAGNDAVKSCGAICGCHQQCPCRKAGCATKAVDISLCSGTTGVVSSCTMPGNCGCNKGSVGKL